ncbi:hypothetical protein C2845_PM11G00140 [Panicum miliaceum]|uniref:Uncharacterized protein n=1 Tax=Panicum miliaceum TaxID=4540 RepID=A0A3L6RQ21_PANMI|nr:hypothetical protein C2845_PM11G00140 [Panicum miliaceum]
MGPDSATAGCNFFCTHNTGRALYSGCIPDHASHQLTQSDLGPPVSLLPYEDGVPHFNGDSLNMSPGV